MHRNHQELSSYRVTTGGTDVFPPIKDEFNDFASLTQSDWLALSSVYDHTNIQAHDLPACLQAFLPIDSSALE